MSQGTTDAEYVRRLQGLKRLCGGYCRKCGETEQLEFAHTKPTGLKGAGRGARRRFLDVVRNPDSYELLCRKCHGELDGFAGYGKVGFAKVACG
jgi:hypothetical protein